MAILFTDLAEDYAFNPAAFVNRKTADLGLTPASSYYCEQITPATGRPTFNLRPTSDQVATAVNGEALSVVGGALVAGGGAYALSEASPVVTLTATGLAFTGPCEYGGLVIRAVTGTVNLVVYDALSATGTPIHTENAVTLGGKPWAGAGMNRRRVNTNGVYVVASGGGTFTVDVDVN